VRVVCPLTVGGSFEARTAALAGTLVVVGAQPVTLAGELAVDLRTLDTGIDLRNEHMRSEYLEVGKGEAFVTAVLSEIRLGAGEAELGRKTSFTGVLALHGVKKAIAGAAEVRREAGRVHVDASFPVTLTDFAIPKPQYLGVGLKNDVQVKVSLNATTDSAP
jgi:polyisoprenoid-binding protein YceI